MKYCRNTLLTFIFLVSIPIYGQQNDTIEVKTVEEAINITLRNFRKSINNENAFIYCMLKNKLGMKDVDFNERTLLVEGGINAELIDRNTSKYLLTFYIIQKESDIIIDVGISTLVKKSRKKIEYTVQSYDIPTTFRIAISYSAVKEEIKAQPTIWE
jgi:hypothetical protein